MQHHRSLEHTQITAPTVLTIGKFNGMHLGHQHLLAQVVARAQQIGGESAALTFQPHPTLVLQPEHERVYLAPESERIALIAATGIDHLIVLRFDQALMELTAEAYMRNLCDRINLRELWVGPDLRVGYRRQGTVEVLRQLSEQLG